MKLNKIIIELMIHLKNTILVKLKTKKIKTNFKCQKN